MRKQVYVCEISVFDTGECMNLVTTLWYVDAQHLPARTISYSAVMVARSLSWIFFKKTYPLMLSAFCFLAVFVFKNVHRNQVIHRVRKKQIPFSDSVKDFWTIEV